MGIEMTPCPHGNRIEGGICLRLSHGLPLKYSQAGWWVMCEKEQCPIYNKPVLSFLEISDEQRAKNNEIMELKNRIFNMIYMAMNGV